MAGAASDSRYVLGIEAATPAGGVALATPAGQLRAHSWRLRTGAQTPYLLADIDRLLHEEGLAPEALAAIAVTLGPGGFTGLRVGLALAKTLAEQLGCALYGFSTLEALALRCGSPGQVVVPLLDARRREVYWGCYRIDDDGLSRPLCADAVAAPERVGGWLAEQAAAGVFAGSSSQPLLLAGSGAAFYRELLLSHAPAAGAWRVAVAPSDSPGADSVALLGAAALRSGRAGLDPLAAEPMYLRGSDAARRHPDGVPGARAVQPSAAGGAA